ncbi:outer membrane protein assembly factor BamB [Thiolapillus sp.]|uniref:outer membrane protein assembly factor BamB n=1 Tax=Thiolapillus sp. TaxID=2017437 RepID=UPI003AF8E81C
MRLVAVFFLSLQLLGCAALQSTGEVFGDLIDSLAGGEDNTAPPNELLDYEAEIKIEKLWSEGIGDGYDELFINLVPAVSGEKIIAADRDGLLQARDRSNGSLLWENDSQLPIAAGPGVGGGLAVVGCSDAQVAAFDLESGELAWQASVSSEVLSVPLIVQGMVIVRTVDGKMFALNADDGEELWSYERNVPILSIRGEGTPVIEDDKVIAGYANGKLIALQLSDGKFIWEASIAIPKGRSEIERLVDLGVNPVVNDGVIYVASYQSGTGAVFALDGDVLWRNEDISSSTGMDYDWRYLYLTDAVSDVWQIDQRSGRALWKQKELHQRRLTAPAVYENYVVVADFEGYVHWLSDDDGRQLGRIQITDEAIMAQPVVVDDIVYVYATDGTLAALQVQQ